MCLVERASAEVKKKKKKLRRKMQTENKMNMYSVLMEFDGCTHKDCQWDGLVCGCVHMTVIVQEWTSLWGCEMACKRLP